MLKIENKTARQKGLLEVAAYTSQPKNKSTQKQYQRPRKLLTVKNFSFILVQFAQSRSLSVRVSKLLQFLIYLCSDFKFRLQIIFVKKISFILVRCAQPRASSVMVEKRVLTSLLALKLFELLFFASTRQNCARSLLKSHLNFHTDNMLRK